MNIHLELEEDGKLARTLSCSSEPGDSLADVARRLAEQIGLEADDILPDLIPGGETDSSSPVDKCLCDGHRARLRRVCLDLHFETEEKRHLFPVRAHWRRVHRWGCREFNVGRDACANLELHESAPTGPALNEAVPIGHFSGCKVVWLVKPGPEPNGR